MPATKKLTTKLAETTLVKDLEDLQDKKELDQGAKVPLLERQISKKTFYLSQLIILFIGFAYVTSIYIYIYKPLPFWENNKSFWDSFNPVTKGVKKFSLEVSTPENNYLSFDKAILVSGKTSPNSWVVIVSQFYEYITQASNTGEFSKVVNLNPDLNNLTIISYDELGNSKTVEKLIFYSEEKL